MSVKIRLSRQGAKRKPVYVVVATDSQRRRDGGYFKKLGLYFPKEADPKKKLQVDTAAIEALRKQGAQLSQTVGQLLQAQAK